MITRRSLQLTTRIITVLIGCCLTGCALYTRTPITLYVTERDTGTPVETDFRISHDGEVINQPKPLVGATDVNGIAHVNAVKSSSILGVLEFGDGIFFIWPHKLREGGEAHPGSAQSFKHWRVWVAPGTHDAECMRAVAERAP